MYIPLLGRLAFMDWPIIITSFILAWFEFIVSVIARLLPLSVIDVLANTTKIIYTFTPNPINLIYSTLDDGFIYSYLNYNVHGGLDRKKYDLMIDLLNSKNIQEMCGLFGYEVENRVIQTDDDYLLTIHRIIKPHSNVKKNGKVIYLHHGLLMNSEIWVTMIDKYSNLPFVLFELGYDVWLGNNRGNKYSQKHLFHKVDSERFWDFSMDEFALFDIPNTIDYILRTTGSPKLTYIGFSQGNAQAFASISIRPELNSKIEQVISISPATTPHGLYSTFLDVLLKSSPNIIFLLFSRKILIPSVIIWQKIIYPPFFDTLIDISNYILFNWKSSNITKFQKISSYAHLYSPTSVKTVVHWFQIISHKNFQMYYDKSSILSGLSPISYPLKNIQIPIHLIYGTIDSLVDINVMKSQLPEDLVTVQAVEGHEHLDNIWGSDVDQHVFRYVLEHLKEPTLPSFDKDEFIYRSYLKSASSRTDESIYEGDTSIENNNEVIHRNPSTGGTVFI